MDFLFNCPKCQQELEVDDSGAGEEIDCPSCGEKIRIPEPGKTAVTARAAEAEEHESASPSALNTMATSAAAKVEMHLKVPVHSKKVEESLIAKPLAPLEVTAKESDRQLKVRCIRRADCMEVGHDKFEETVTRFLGKIGEPSVVSITTLSYSYIDPATQKLLDDYGVMVVYRG